MRFDLGTKLSAILRLALASTRGRRRKKQHTKEVTLLGDEWLI